jgi:hypothetical protein
MFQRFSPLLFLIAVWLLAGFLREPFHGIALAVALGIVGYRSYQRITRPPDGVSACQKCGRLLAVPGPCPDCQKTP